MPALTTAFEDRHAVSVALYVHYVTNPLGPGRFVASRRLSVEFATNPVRVRGFVTFCMLDGDGGQEAAPSLPSFTPKPHPPSHGVLATNAEPSV
jgi:hypothetical protein